MSEICVLDEDNCLSLESILRAFHCGIKEEQSWALIYQSITSLKQYISQDHYKHINQLLSKSHLLIKNNGTICVKTWQSSDNKVTVKRVISSLGIFIYEALDYGNDSDEELVIMPSLENVFDIMTRDLPFDEGIEEEDDGPELELIDEILRNCENRLFDNRNTSEHYRNVCRALVAEALELSTFLNQISIGTKELQKKCESGQEIDNFQVEVWAHLWMKVMRELRAGVTLKSIQKQDFSESQRREYELTPFEMLLDDINSRRYTLKKVVSLPKKVEKDARTLILEFIRSRPPLRPVSQRKLKPLPHMQPSLHEKLMNSIKQTHELRPTPPLLRRKYESFHMPRGKRYSDIYSLNNKPTTQTTSIDEDPSETVSAFRRFSFRSLSLRNYPVDRDKVDIKIPSTAVPLQSAPKRRQSFWGRLCQTLW